MAHNAEYIAINGQLFIPLLGNPAGIDGVKLLPAPFNDSYEINPNLLPSSVVWYHPGGADHLRAHRRGGPGPSVPGTRVAQRCRGAASEWPWIVAMVGYTMTSLWLLAQPLVQETSSAAVRAAAHLAVLLR